MADQVHQSDIFCCSKYVFSTGQTVLCTQQQSHLFHFLKKLAESIGYTKICMHAQPATIPASILYPPDPTRSNFEPARPSPSKFWTRPTRPVRRKICPNPPLPGRVPYPSGRVGSGCSTLLWTKLTSLRAKITLYMGSLISAIWKYPISLKKFFKCSWLVFSGMQPTKIVLFSFEKSEPWRSCSGIAITHFDCWRNESSILKNDSISSKEWESDDTEECDEARRDEESKASWAVSFCGSSMRRLHDLNRPWKSCSKRSSRWRSYSSFSTSDVSASDSVEVLPISLSFVNVSSSSVIIPSFEPSDEILFWHQNIRWIIDEKHRRFTLILVQIPCIVSWMTCQLLNVFIVKRGSTFFPTSEFLFSNTWWLDKNNNEMESRKSTSAPASAETFSYSPCFYPFSFFHSSDSINCDCKLSLHGLATMKHHEEESELE